jgi:hypothetical protein
MVYSAPTDIEWIVETHEETGQTGRKRLSVLSQSIVPIPKLDDRWDNQVGSLFVLL